MDESPEESTCVDPAPFCIRCKYDLRATPAEGTCPECSAPCAWSLWSGTASGERWRWYVRLGALLLCAALASQLAISFVWGLLVFRLGWYQFHWLSWGLNVVPFYGLLLGGSVCLTVAAPVAIGAQWSVWIRRLTRGLVIFGAGGLIALPFLRMLLDSLAYDYWFYHRPAAGAVIEFAQDWSESVFGTGAWLGVCLTALHAVSVVRHLHAPGLLWQSKRSFIGLLILVFIWQMTGPAIDALHPIIGDGWYFTILDSNLLRYVMYGLWLARWAMSIWAAVVLWNMARSFARAQ